MIAPGQRNHRGTEKGDSFAIQWRLWVAGDLLRGKLWGIATLISGRLCHPLNELSQRLTVVMISHYQVLLSVRVAYII